MQPEVCLFFDILALRYIYQAVMIGRSIAMVTKAITCRVESTTTKRHLIHYCPEAEVLKFTLIPIFSFLTTENEMKVMYS